MIFLAQNHKNDQKWCETQILAKNFIFEEYFVVNRGLYVTKNVLEILKIYCVSTVLSLTETRFLASVLDWTAPGGILRFWTNLVRTTKNYYKIIEIKTSLAELSGDVPQMPKPQQFDFKKIRIENLQIILSNTAFYNL